MLGTATRAATLIAALALGFGTACSSGAPEPETTAALPAVEGPPPVVEPTADANAAIPATLMEAAGIEDAKKAEALQQQANAAN